MAGSRRIVIEFLGKDVSAGKTASDIDGKYSKLQGRMNRVGNVAGKVLAGGLLLGGAAAVKAGRAAIDDEAAQSKLEQTLRRAAGASGAQVAATEKWITAQGKALGISDDELRPALGRLATATGDVGKAQDLTALAMDVSAGSGKSLTQVTEALQKGVNGSVGGLSRLGVATKDANGKTKSLDQITKDLAKTYGGAAAKAADTTAGKQKKLTVQFGELQEQIGTKLIPVFDKLTEWGLKAIDWMSKHETTVKTLAATIGGLVATLWAVSKVIKAVTIVQTALNLVMAMNPFGLVVIAIAALVAGLIFAYKKSDTFRKIVDGAFKAVGKAAKWMWEGVLKPVFKFLVNAWLNVAGWIINGAAKAFGWVPGIGPKLRRAADWFNQFKKDVNRQIDGIKDPKIKVKMEGDRHAISSLSTIKRLIFDIIDSKPQLGGAQNLTDLLTGRVGGRAMGGPVTAGTPYIVGERRPELFVPSTSGRIVSRVPGGGGDTYVVNIHGVMDKQAAGREVRKVLLDLKRTVGPLGLA